MLCKDKIALVTGGASGIGRAAAIAFAREGASVTVADRDRRRGEEVAQEIQAVGGKAIFTETDVSSEASIQAMVQATLSAFGGLDMAFNNAGSPGGYATATSCTHDEWSKIIDVNMKSVWLCMKYEIPEMLKRGGGAIVNTASRAGDSASPNMFSYVATKHGVAGMSRSAAIDFAAQNIRVNALMPGFTLTPMLETAAVGAGLPSLDAVAHAMVPMKRLGRPEEQAEAAVWLCSDRASYITGIALEVDGGMSATH